MGIEVLTKFAIEKTEDGTVQHENVRGIERYNSQHLPD